MNEVLQKLYNIIREIIILHIITFDVICRLVFESKHLLYVHAGKYIFYLFAVLIDKKRSS